MQTETGPEPVRQTADFISGVVFVLLGVAVFYLSWTMPRLEARNIHPMTIPGLVPMGLGFALTVLGGLLAFKARHGITEGFRGLLAILTTIEAARVGAALGLFVIFTLVLIGWLPFWAAAMLFIFAFVITMEGLLAHRPFEKPTAWRDAIVWGAITAVMAGAGIYYLFSELLLVRLP